LLAHRVTLMPGTTPIRLPATVYSVYRQLPSISGYRPLHLRHDDAPCRGDRWRQRRKAK